MAQKAIRESDAKKLLNRYLKVNNGMEPVSGKIIAVGPETDVDELPEKYPWLKKERLVVKPDQLIKRRGKNQLLLLDKPFADIQKWIYSRQGKSTVIDEVKGELSHFLIEPFIPHEPSDEYYLCIRSVREGDEILFYHEGGMDVGDVESKAEKLLVRVDKKADLKQIEEKLLLHISKAKKEKIAAFIKAVVGVYVELHVTYLEINPFVYVSGSVSPLDVAARLDDTAQFECENKWGEMEFPEPFGKFKSKEEEFIEELDARTGASLKLTLLNPNGRIWTLVAGGGASVVFADTVTDMGFGSELANYGEYSGDPDEDMTCAYASTVLDLMTRVPHPDGKVLLIGGGIANFTDVAKTFKGIFRALRIHEKKLKENKVKIYVRRAGPNYREGLEKMKSIGKELGLPVDVYGPEAHMTVIVSLAINDLN